PRLRGRWIKDWNILHRSAQFGSDSNAITLPQAFGPRNRQTVEHGIVPMGSRGARRATCQIESASPLSAFGTRVLAGVDDSIKPFTARPILPLPTAKTPIKTTTTNRTTPKAGRMAWAVAATLPTASQNVADRLNALQQDFEGPDGHAGPLPLHRKFWAFPRVRGLDLNGSVAACQRHLAAASGIGIDAEAAGVDGHRVPFVLHGARHLVPINAFCLCCPAWNSDNCGTSWP